MTPAPLVDLNLDGKPEAIVVGFDGFVVAVDISTRKQLWNFSLPQAESYRSASLSFHFFITFSCLLSKIPL